MTQFVALRPRTYSYLTDYCKEDKKAKGTKKGVIKRRLKFNDYKDCLLINKFVLKSQQRFKSERHDVYVTGNVYNLFIMYNHRLFCIITILVNVIKITELMELTGYNKHLFWRM